MPTLWTSTSKACISPTVRSLGAEGKALRDAGEIAVVEL
jgi:hypothetical protein